jgi:hypothetical protein
METNINKYHFVGAKVIADKTIKISPVKDLTCIICNKKLSIKDDKHTCAYRTSNEICINYNKSK